MEYAAYFMDIWSILRPSDKFSTIWYIFPLFGIFSKEKTGNTDSEAIPARENK
jgi:hypothetical protein